MRHELSGRDIPLIHRAVAKTHAIKPIDGDMNWGIDGTNICFSTPFQYEQTFKNFLDEDNAASFEDWVAKRRGKGLPSHILDLFGGGYFMLHPTSYTSMTGVRLLDNSDALVAKHSQKPNEDNPYYDASPTIAQSLFELKHAPNWGIVEGNLFESKTWRNLDSKNEKRGIKQYDLIVARPEQPFEEKVIIDEIDQDMWRSNPDTVGRVYSVQFLRLLQQAYQRLNPSGGTIMTQVPEFISELYLDDFVQVAREHGKIGASQAPAARWDGQRYLKLVKNYDSVRSLQDLVTAHM